MTIKKKFGFRNHDLGFYHIEYNFFNSLKEARLYFLEKYNLKSLRNCELWRV